MRRWRRRNLFCADAELGALVDGLDALGQLGVQRELAAVNMPCGVRESTLDRNSLCCGKSLSIWRSSFEVSPLAWLRVDFCLRENSLIFSGSSLQRRPSMVSLVSRRMRRPQNSGNVLVAVLDPEVVVFVEQGLARLEAPGAILNFVLKRVVLQLQQVVRRSLCAVSSMWRAGRGKPGT